MDFTMTGGEVKDNSADENGGAVYVAGGNFEMLLGEIRNDEDEVIDTTTGTLKDNSADKNGGGVYVSGGNFTMTYGSVERNRAEENGGGVYVSGGVGAADGNVVMSGGAVKDNRATVDGGGMYVSGGSVTLSGGSVSGNEAVSGGGIGVADGDVLMTGGEVKDNSAAVNGGGVDVSGGNFAMADGSVTGNSASNGGGINVSDGDVLVISGSVDENTAAEEGGGMYISALTKEVHATMLSGSLSGNNAGTNGGGMAVDKSDYPITVDVGCLLDHFKGSETPVLPIEYTDDYAEYATYEDGIYSHDACPQVERNSCSNIGGGFYLASDKSTLYFYCLVEKGNTAADGKENCWGMDVEGGAVSIGDPEYHNVHYAGKPRETVYGYVQMSSPILVNGGKVDIYGDMTNPSFQEEITVDIKDADDSFEDHRRLEDETRIHYKVHYVENFLDPETDVRTGKYIAEQYPAGADGSCDIVIQSALFDHPGYTIKGWNTKMDGSGKWYDVSKHYDLKDEQGYMGVDSVEVCPLCGAADTYLLRLYAQWEANGYKVHFDPNQPSGWDGDMADITCNYDEVRTLPPNEFTFRGYVFVSWNTKADGTGTSYADQAELINLTKEEGVTVPLYAQWKECPHDWEYSANGAHMDAECRLCHETAWAELSASNGVYSGNSHKATLTTSNNWAGGKTVVYEGTPIGESVLSKPDPETVGGPINAGIYTASLTAGGETIRVDFTVAKATQSAPPKPGYTPDTNEDGQTVSLVIEAVAPSASSSGEALYRLTYYEGTQQVSTDWKAAESGVCTIVPTQALTNYYVEAYYPELENYAVSTVTKADRVFFFHGDVTFRLEVDEGILCDEPDFDVYEEEGNETLNGINLTPALKNGFYLTAGDFEITTTVTVDGNTAEPEVTHLAQGDKYSYTGIEPNTDIVIHVGNAKPIPNVTTRATEKQVFGDVSGDAAVSISNTSAFTAYYKVDDYDETAYGVPYLSFEESVPQGTTVIMMTEGAYWYWTADSATYFVPVENNFIRMGAEAEYVVPSSDTLEYQFIVDFSRADGICVNGFTMALEADGKSAYVPSFDGNVVTATTAADQFSLDQTSEGQKIGVELTYTSGGTASRWDDRASALVLEPNGNLPADAVLRLTVGRRTVVCRKNGVGKFILPLGLLTEGTLSISIALESAMLTDGRDYSFGAKWMVSDSEADEAPLSGDAVVSGETLTVTADVPDSPALRISGANQVVERNGTLEATVEYRNMTGCTMEAALLKKIKETEETDGTQKDPFLGTGWTQEIQSSGNDGSKSLQISLANMEPGSYRLEVTVKEDVLVRMRVPYYFIIADGVMDEETP